MGLTAAQTACESLCSTGYLAATLDSCVADCTVSGWVVAAAGAICVVTCGEREWKDTGTGRCRYCTEAGGMMQFCIKCTGLNIC